MNLCPVLLEFTHFHSHQQRGGGGSFSSILSPAFILLDFFFFLMLTILTCVRRYHIVLLIHNCLILTDAEHLFMCFIWRNIHLNLVPLFDWVVCLILKCNNLFVHLGDKFLVYLLFANISSVVRSVFFVCFWFPLLCQHLRRIRFH